MTCFVPVCVCVWENTPPRKKDSWADRPSKHPIRGKGAVSAEGLQGKALKTKQLIFTHTRAHTRRYGDAYSRCLDLCSYRLRSGICTRIVVRPLFECIFAGSTQSGSYLWGANSFKTRAALQEFRPEGCQFVSLFKWLYGQYSQFRFAELQIGGLESQNHCLFSLQDALWKSKSPRGWTHLSRLIFLWNGRTTSVTCDKPKPDQPDLF